MFKENYFLHKNIHVLLKQAIAVTFLIVTLLGLGCISIYDVVNQKNKDGNTPLHLAIIENKMEAAEVFIENKAEINARNNKEETPLFLASQNGNLELVKMLLSENADANIARKDDGVTPLLMASKNGHTEVVKLLLSANADVNAAHKIFGTTALNVASYYGHSEIVKLLLDRKAAINSETKSGITPLLAATKEGHSEIVKLLLAAGEKSIRRDDANILQTSTATNESEYNDKKNNFSSEFEFTDSQMTYNSKTHVATTECTRNAKEMFWAWKFSASRDNLSELASCMVRTLDISKLNAENLFGSPDKKEGFTNLWLLKIDKLTEEEVQFLGIRGSTLMIGFAIINKADPSKAKLTRIKMRVDSGILEKNITRGTVAFVPGIIDLKYSED